MVDVFVWREDDATTTAAEADVERRVTVAKTLCEAVALTAATRSCQVVLRKNSGRQRFQAVIVV